MSGLPVHVQQTLGDIAAMRLRLDEAEAALRAIYAVSVVVTPAIAAPAPKGPVAVPRAPRAKAEKPSADAAPSASGRKYDDGIVRALRSETAQLGMTSSDVCRVFTGPGKPEEVSRISGAITLALQSLQKRGIVRKDGRHWYIVRANDQEMAS